jgi:uroporphyrinogen decarboxylase
MNGAERFLAACARRGVDRTPVWMMRQAGRYLPEYRAVRERVDFMTLCKSPDLAAEVSLQPVERFGVDACIIFSDILVPIEAMGASVAFGDGGPVLESPVRAVADVDRLGVPDPVTAMPFVMNALRIAFEALAGRAALVGFVGGPFTLASYLIEGGGSRTFASTKALLYSEPVTMHALLDKLADTVSEYAAAQAAAGAQAVQIFDTWAGELSPGAYEQFALPYQSAIVKRIRRAGVPAILYVNGSAGKLELLREAGADVLSVDWRLRMRDARSGLGEAVALQGNVDPCVLLSNPAAVTAAAHEAMEGAGAIGHILNLGHGILPTTSLECARALVDAAKIPVGASGS